MNWEITKQENLGDYQLFKADLTEHNLWHWSENVLFIISCCTEALKAVIGAAMAGVSVLSLCEKGDAYIMAETGKIFKKEKDMKKGQYFVGVHLSVTCVSLRSLNPTHSLCLPSTGIAFPTCVSVNNCVCHFSPLKSDPDVILKDGDLVKM